MLTIMKLKFTPFTSSDIEILLSWVKSEKELKQWAGPVLFEWPLTKDQLSQYLARAEGEPPNVYIYKVINQENITVGHIELDKIDWSNKTTVLSRVMIAPAFRNQRIGYKLVNSILTHAFENIGLKEIQLSVYSFNLPAIRCYEASGFKTVSLIKDSCKCGSESWDTQRMSISLTEYQKNIRQLVI